jgi:hypothetical protein
MSPVPATIFMSQTYKEARTTNLLTTIPAHQLQHNQHPSPSIVMFPITSTLNITKEIFNTDPGNVPEWTKEIYPLRKETI